MQTRVAQYDYRSVARVPLDFAEEILPADAVVGTDSAAPEAAPSDTAPPPTKRGRRGKFPQVWQVDEMDCGAACVAMVCRRFGRAVSLTAVRRALHTSTAGTSLLGITAGAKELGLTARALKASKSKLDDLPLPAVVHWGGNHWVVAYEVTPTAVRVADPARGRRKVPRQEFEATWSGFAAILGPTPALADAPEERSNLPWIFSFLRPLRARPSSWRSWPPGCR